MALPTSGIVLAAGLLLSGCATIETSGAGQGKPGISYNLPKGEFELTVVDNSGALAVHLAGPVMVPDPRYPLIAHLPHSGTSDNVVTVNVDPKTNLISKVEATSTGQLAAIIKNVAETIAFLQSSEGENGSIIFDRLYDLDDLPQTAAGEVNQFLDGYFVRSCSDAIADTAPLKAELSQSGYDDASLKTDRKTRLQYCQKLKAAGLGTATKGQLVTIVVGARPQVMTANWNSTNLGTSTMDKAGKLCLNGICYRPLTAVTINLTVARAFSKSGVFLIPDETRIENIPLAQGVFAEQKYTITFTDGVPTEYLQNSKSELVGLSALPLDVAKAVISAPAEAIGLKTDNLKKQGAYLDQVVAYQKSQKSLADTCTSSSIKCPSKALRMIGGDIATTAKTTGQETGLPANQGAVAGQPANNGTQPVNGGQTVHQDGPDDK